MTTANSARPGRRADAARAARLLAAPLLGAAMLGAGAQPAWAQAAEFGSDQIGLAFSGSNALCKATIKNRTSGQVFADISALQLVLQDGSTIDGCDLVTTGPAESYQLAAQADAPRLADRAGGKGLRLQLRDKQNRLKVTYAFEAPADANYLRMTVQLTAISRPVKVAKVALLKGRYDGGQVMGTTAGAPVVAGDTFLQFENPLANADYVVDSSEVELSIKRVLPVEQGKVVEYSAIVGAAKPGQLRRGYSEYIENARAHPVRPFLHYNSWYDIGYFTPYTQDEAIERINTYCRELTSERGVKLDSFLFDDGWDDLTGSWRFSKRFPNGFAPVRDAAKRCGAMPGIWLSPWGGYGQPKKDRVSAGVKAGYETIDGGFALSGPKYYQRFEAATRAMVRDYGINQFKFDGTGNADRVIAGSKYDSDFAAAIGLIKTLRQDSPDLFINLTTGTYPSPAWLLYADTIWRGGSDHNFTGAGTRRQRWITYRDQQVYEKTVQAGPLFPINSLMLHGIIYSQNAVGLSDDPGNDFGHEVRSFFGTGTQLQELYITPKLLTKQNWDDLATAAKWSRSNADVLKDVHWIGGNPGRLEIYGWAAWAPRKAIVTLRNPDKVARSFLLDLNTALELPDGAAASFASKVVWSDGAQVPATLAASDPVVVKLAPFEVLTLELFPLGGK